MSTILKYNHYWASGICFWGIPFIKANLRAVKDSLKQCTATNDIEFLNEQKYILEIELTQRIKNN